MLAIWPHCSFLLRHGKCVDVTAAQRLRTIMRRTYKNLSVCLQVAEANNANERDVEKEWQWLEITSPRRTREAERCASLHERVIAAGRHLGGMSPEEQARYWRRYMSALDQVHAGLKHVRGRTGSLFMQVFFVIIHQHHLFAYCITSFHYNLYLYKFIIHCIMFAGPYLPLAPTHACSGHQRMSSF